MLDYTSGANVCYDYAPVRLDLGENGHQDTHRITARWVEDLSAGTTADYVTYSYDGTYTNYP